MLERVVWFAEHISRRWSGLLDAGLASSRRQRWSGLLKRVLGSHLSTLVWPHLVAGAGLRLAALVRLLVTGAPGGGVRPAAHSWPGSQPS